MKIKEQFWAFVRKEFIHIYRDKRTMLILLIMPIIQIILFGFAITTDVHDVNIAILSPVHDNLTDRIIHRIKSSNYFTVKDILSSESQVYEQLATGNVKLVVAINADLERNLVHTNEMSIQLITDGTEPNQAYIINNYAMGIIESELKQYISNLTSPIHITTRMLYNPQQNSSYNFVPGIMGMILMLICSMMTSISIVKEKDTGTMEILLASPLNPLIILVAKLIPYFLLSLANMTSILLLSFYVLHVPIAGNLLLLVFVSVLFIIVALSFGLMISNVSTNQSMAMVISSMVLITPVILLSGMMYPIESMPNILQYFSSLLPATWYIIAIKKIMIQGSAFTDISTEVIILIVMALVSLIVSLKQFKIRLA